MTDTRSQEEKDALLALYERQAASLRAAPDDERGDDAEPRGVEQMRYQRALATEQQA